MIVYSSEFEVWWRDYMERTESMCGSLPECVDAAKGYLWIGWQAARAARRRRWFTVIHNLVAHPLMVTGQSWSIRFHDWTSKQMV